MASLPVLGGIDWKWLIIGVIADRFILPFILALFGRLRAGNSAPAKAAAA